jgi:hypothetical protein
LKGAHFSAHLFLGPIFDGDRSFAPYHVAMHSNISRRALLQAVPLAVTTAAAARATPADLPPLAATFPTQPPELARQMVAVSHGNVKAVRELVEARPSLAKAAWDWGFGDWETALGAASHVGNREIAEYLISKGAHPTMFSATMLGHLDLVKAFIAAQPGVQRIAGPHGISLLAHARNGGAPAEPVLRYLESLGDADAPPATPLTEAEAAALAGVYRFGPGETDKVEITANKANLLFTRQGTTGRGLVHLGGHVFHPAGAAAVRIQFIAKDDGIVLAVKDPDLVLAGRR